MKTEHIQTLPFLSRSMIRDAAGVNRNLNFFGSLVGFLRLMLEISFGVFILIADQIKFVVNSISQGAGIGVRTTNREGEDELLTGKRMLLASTYRHSRTYTYVRDVGPETYIGWFTHHEPSPGMKTPFGLTFIFLVIGFLLGSETRLPLVFIFGVLLGIAYLLWFAPWALNRAGALPQPRYVSAMVFALFIPLGLFVSWAALLIPTIIPLLLPVWIPLSIPLSLFGIGRGVFGIGSPMGLLDFGLRGSGGFDPFLMLLAIAAFTACFMLCIITILVFLRTLTSGISHFNQFDAETHAQIVKERIGLILSEYLETAGYSPTEIGDILAQQTPGAGRYRRTRG